MSNLEPIEENDLNTESKFGKIEGEGKTAEAKKEDLAKPEGEPTVAKALEGEPAKEIIFAEKDSAYNDILSKVQAAPHPVSDEEVKKDAGETFQKQDAESQVQHLVDLAMNKGVIHAVKVARHLEDNYVLDMFHDKLLADELYEALVKRGMISSE